MAKIKPTRRTTLKLKRTLARYQEEYYINDQAILAGQCDDEERQKFLDKEIKAICNLLNYDFVKKRADIIDRNGIILARSIDVYSAGVRSKLVQDKKKLLINLKLIFPELDANKIREKLNSNNFFYIKKRLTEDEKTKLWLIGNKAIVFEKKQFRIYPQQNLLSHILGQIDDNNNGISGL